MFKHFIFTVSAWGYQLRGEMYPPTPGSLKNLKDKRVKHLLCIVTLADANSKPSVFQGMPILKETQEKPRVPSFCSQERNLGAPFRLHCSVEESRGASPKTSIVKRTSRKGHGAWSRASPDLPCSLTSQAVSLLQSREARPHLSSPSPPCSGEEGGGRPMRVTVTPPLTHMVRWQVCRWVVYKS